MLVKSQVKYIQSLGQKKFRDAEGVFIVEGPKMVEELIRGGRVGVQEVFAVREWIEGRSLEGVVGRITEVKASELERLSSLSTPNQVLAVFSRPVFPVADPEDSVSLMLDGIQDPGNMGTIVRIADWFGIRQVIASRDSSDIFGGKAVQSTMGSISRVQVIYEDLPEVVRRHPGLPVYGAVLGGEPLYGMSRMERGMIVIGNESRGIRQELLAVVPKGVTIPRIGEAESLNAAVAAGILLSHLVGK